AWREVGPAAAGGRVSAVAGSNTDPKLYWIGSAGGGAWKSENGGQTWDAKFTKIGAIGDVAIDPNDNDTVWVGTGEANPRNDVSYGNGIWKTTDGGGTWTNVGLATSRQISRILIDSNDSKHVIVGVLGDLFADSVDRGVYVTWDGGKTWTKTLYAGPSSGASDMAMSAQHPNVIYAGLWQFRRQPWNFSSGGADDGLYKSTDGGKSWTKLSGHGLPEGTTGRYGLAVAPSDENRVYALIESTSGILWRSDDAGANWTLVSSDTNANQRPFYFSHVTVDPKNKDRVYGISNNLTLSTDGGKKFHSIARQTHVDYHAMWIAANDPTRMIVGEDGGYALTNDKGANWFFSASLPIAQIYHVGLSNENPYTICAGLQDNDAWCGPSNSLDPSGIGNKYWFTSTGGDGEWAVPDPIDPNWIWSDSENGFLTLYNKKTQDGWTAIPYLSTAHESYDLSTSKYRFNWDSPVAFAPWNGHIAWIGANVVFQTIDRGISWKPISPDLTVNEKSHQKPTGGPMVHDVSGAEYSDTILDIEGSSLRKGEIWVGTDDGLVQLTRDGGKHWRNVTPPDLPSFGRVETIAPSPLVAGTAYMILDRHFSGDLKPYAFVTHDYGRSWTTIVTGLAADIYLRTIRPDARNKDVVYLGTEQGIQVSFDGAKSWQAFQNEMPASSVRDIRSQTQANDLVVATHGRSVYIMDDLAPVQGLRRALAGGAYLFAPRISYQYNLHQNDEGWNYTAYAGDNPPYGAIVSFYQKQPAKVAPKIEIIDATGKVIRTVSGTHKAGGKDVPYVDNASGVNRYVWDFQIDGPVKWDGGARGFQGPSEGPGAPPGSYAVRLTLDGKTWTQKFVAAFDPRTAFTQAQADAGYAFSKKYMGALSTLDTALNNLDKVKKALDDASADAKKTNLADLQKTLDAATAAHKTLFDSLTANFQNGEDSIQRPGALREDIGGLMFTGFVTPPAVSFAKRMDAAFADGMGRYNAFVTGTLPGVNAALKAAGKKELPSVKTLKTTP
ncbi:MAG: hypothetical protein M3R30_08875, partial [Candidatus Eremiobacteraeota bacterium]|nr:hypothetical protein [Candidatus Eremiobacteraeota bacterium]